MDYPGMTLDEAFEAHTLGRQMELGILTDITAVSSNILRASWSLLPAPTRSALVNAVVQQKIMPTLDSADKVLREITESDKQAERQAIVDQVSTLRSKVMDWARVAPTNAEGAVALAGANEDARRLQDAARKLRARTAPEVPGGFTLMPSTGAIPWGLLLGVGGGLFGLILLVTMMKKK